MANADFLSQIRSKSGNFGPVVWPPVVPPAVPPTRRKPPAKGWTAAEKARYKAMRIASPEFMGRVGRSIAERFEVLVLRKG